jgi:hypothetical protein
MNATTIFPDTAEPGSADQTMAGMSWQIPLERQPKKRTLRLSMNRTKKMLQRTPRRPIQVIRIEYWNTFLTPAMVRKYVV